MVHPMAVQWAELTGYQMAAWLVQVLVQMSEHKMGHTMVDSTVALMAALLVVRWGNLMDERKAVRTAGPWVAWMVH